ncbi:preprotein translocase subunit SecA [Achromobacter aloeverae]
MDSVAIAQPNPLYPERESERYANRLEAWGTGWLRGLRRQWRQPLWRSRRIVARVRREGDLLGQPSLEQLREKAAAAAYDLRCQGITAATAARAFALVREAARQTLGKTHFDVQVLGGWVMLQGMVAEMHTGEGKTLTATLPAATAALAGLPVHVITTNDYLVERDAAIMAPVYEALGLTVAAVTAEMDIPARRAAYRADIVYCSNKTVVFDYLRDLIVLDDDKDEDTLRLERLRGGAGRTSRLYLRGLCYAIVDEADSVLVDEARTPLIISGVQEQDIAGVTRQAVDLARALAPEHYRVLRDERRVGLTEEGREALRTRCAALPEPWNIPFRREELTLNALTVLHLYQVDEQYIIRDGKIMVVDEFTGRVMADRSWGQGLHQMIEYKEGLALTDPRQTLKSISYQRFFKHYLRLSGMTGTAAEIRKELGRVYDLPVVPIPTHRKSRRLYRPDVVCRTLHDKWAAVCARTAALHARGVPVLIGTRSVAASEEVGRHLAAAGLAPVILNAKQDADEAGMVARAGETGSIMIATNMAGRGTDIALSDEARAAGGLHVILTERHESARIDRQLQGRCARQGDPGHAEAILSLEDAVLDSVARTWMARAMVPILAAFPGLGARWLRHAQRRTEITQARDRKRLVAADEQLEKSLSFSGQGD